MADQKPNLEVELKRLEVDRDGMSLRFKQQELRVLEIEDEKLRIYDNMEATKREIANMDKSIESLQKTLDKQKQEE